MAILEALRKWRHYLLGNKLIIRTDQQSLKFLTSQRLLEGVQHKLMLKLLEFDYLIEYKKGSENSVADALSRKMEHSDTQHYLAISAIVPKWKSEVLQSYDTDEKCTQLLQELALDPASHINYSLSGGILRYKNIIVIGQHSKLCNNLFNTFHASPMGGHSGQKVTDEGMTPRSSIFAYLVPAKEEARSKDTRSPQGPTLRLGVEGKNYL
jgi:hypothetical protein